MNNLVNLTDRGLGEEMKVAAREPKMNDTSVILPFSEQAFQSWLDFMFIDWKSGKNTEIILKTQLK